MRGAGLDPEPPPPEPDVIRGIPCDCGLVECDKCSTEALRLGADVRVAAPAVTELRRWGDVARFKIEVKIESTRETGTVEAYARVEPGPLFAAVAGSLRNGDETLTAELKPGGEARRRYLYTRRLFCFDPVLVLRRGPGTLDLRVFPLRKGVPATVVLEGYVLAEASKPEKVRLYRTDERYLAIVPLATDAHREKAALRDEGGGRSLYFLSRAEARERFGTGVAEEVPFVPALESAATGRGTCAASDGTALAAIAPDAPSPPFVGPDRIREPPPPE